MTCLTDGDLVFSWVAIDITEENSLLLISNIAEGGKVNASVLCEVPRQERNEEPRLSKQTIYLKIYRVDKSNK